MPVSSMTPILPLSSVDGEITYETPPSFLPPTPPASSDPLTAPPAPLRNVAHCDGQTLSPQATLNMLASLIHDWLPDSDFDAETRHHLASVLEEEHRLLADVLQRCDEQREQENMPLRENPDAPGGLYDPA